MVEQAKKRELVALYSFTPGVYTICTPTAVNQPSERKVNALPGPAAGLCVGEGQQGQRGTLG